MEKEFNEIQSDKQNKYQWKLIYESKKKNEELKQEVTTSARGMTTVKVHFRSDNDCLTTARAFLHCPLKLQFD